MIVERTHEICEDILDEVGRAIVGKREVMKRVLLGILCNGHPVRGFPWTGEDDDSQGFRCCQWMRIQACPVHSRSVAR